MAPQPAIQPSHPHFHLQGAVCPVCDQPIPNEKAGQVKARIEARDRAAADALTARLKEQFAAERVQIEANARVVLEQAQRDSAAAIEAVKKESAAAINLAKRDAQQRETVARDEGTKAAQAAAQQQIAALTQAMSDAETAAKQKIEANAHMLALAEERVAQAERGKAEIEATAHDRIAAAEAARVSAEIDAKATRENHEALTKQRLTKPCASSSRRPLTSWEKVRTSTSLKN
jgi:DNA repair exonuclease SbcCD ATPase subunit